MACNIRPENDILFKEKRFLCKYLIRKGANVNYQSIRDYYDGELEYSTALDSVLGSISFWECSTAFENDIKTKNIAESLYILELLVKNNVEPSEESINTIRDFESHDLKEKVRILLHLTREQVA